MTTTLAEHRDLAQPEEDPAITVVCSTCTPHQHVPRPTNCPH